MSPQPVLPNRATGQKERKTLTIHLPPAHVIPDELLARIEHDSAVEGRQRGCEWLGGEVDGPGMDVVG